MFTKCLLGADYNQNRNNTGETQIEEFKISKSRKIELLHQVCPPDSYAEDSIKLILDEVTATCCLGLKNLNKQDFLMCYSLQPSVEHELGFMTNLRIILADRVKNPSGRNNIDEYSTFLNSVDNLPMYELKVDPDFKTIFSNVHPCEHVGASDVFVIGSKADLPNQNRNFNFDIVEKFHRLKKTTPWSKMSVFTKNPICPLTVLFAVKIGSGSHFCQISAMVDFEIPLRVRYQLGI
ncbi:hypothetical protein GEMRC1_008821 [Eukaryota sp. GEM-RC1]